MADAAPDRAGADALRAWMARGRNDRADIFSTHVASDWHDPAFAPDGLAGLLAIRGWQAARMGTAPNA